MLKKVARAKTRIWGSFNLMKLKASNLGFTLIELLIVLAIVGTISALVAPDMWNSYQRANERQQVMSFASSLMALRREAHFSGESLNIPENALLSSVEGSQLPAPPSGWLIESQSTIYFLPSGVTNGASIHFSSPTGRAWELLIQSFDGQISITSQ
jgi:prepilin-type N-terminal cleavage/methylation domain-containing protein